MSRAARRKAPLSGPGPPLSPLPPPVKAPEGAWRFALPVLLLLYLGMAILHAQFTPLGETGIQNAPDEAAHINYIRALAAHHLPTPEDARRDPKQQSYEWHQPPLYYALAAPLLPLGERALRFASIVCGLAGILLIYRAARLLRPDVPQLGTLAAGIAALTPAHIAITSTVNNDVLLEVCFSGALVVLLGALRGGFTLWRAGWLGVAIGAALLTKATGMLLLPVALFALALFWKGGETPANIARGAGWMLLIIATLSGWWFVRNTRLYHEILPLKAFQQEFQGTSQAADWVAALGSWPLYLLLVAQNTFKSFWAVYGTRASAHHFGEQMFLPEQLYWLTGAVSAAMAAGLTRLHFRRKTEFIEAQIHGIWILFATLRALSFAAFILRYFQAQGRYFYPAMLPLCLLGALGWREIFPARYKELASGMLLLVLGLMAAAFLNYVRPQ